MSPRASTFTWPVRATRPCCRSRSGVTSVPASNFSAITSRLTTSYATRNGLWNPRFGTRRCSGIWPPSNPRLCLKPDRDFAPLWPRVAVLPWPDPCPRPMRFFACVAPLGGRKLLKFIVVSAWSYRPGLLHLDEVADFVDHPARRGGVRQFHRVMQAAQAEALHHQLLFLVESNRALDERDLQGLRSLRIFP